MSTRPALALVDPTAGSPAPTPVVPSPRRHAELAVRAWVALQSASAAAAARATAARRDDRGQSTAEYALVILGAAAVAALLVAWASQTNKISRLLDVILDSLINRFR